MTKNNRVRMTRAQYDAKIAEARAEGRAVAKQSRLPWPTTEEKNKSESAATPNWLASGLTNPDHNIDGTPVLVADADAAD